MLKFHLLDIFFLIFHSALILFNMFGWAVKKLRKWNLITLFLTAFSWFVLGLFYGMGYCFLTQWHWNILAKLSVYPAENSYVQYLFRRLLSVQMSAETADRLTLAVFVVSCLFSVLLNYRDFRKKKK